MKPGVSAILSLGGGAHKPGWLDEAGLTRRPRAQGGRKSILRLILRIRLLRPSFKIAFGALVAEVADRGLRVRRVNFGFQVSGKPNFFILGAPKCGTTSVAHWLNGHPEIFMSPEKEPHFFNTDDKQLITTLDAYENLFQGACSRHRAVGEASVWYLSSAEAVPNILLYQPEARFIVMIRNPVEMAPALHAEMLLSGHENVDDFSTAWALQTERLHGRRLPALCWARRRLLYGEICSLGRQFQRLLSLAPGNRVLPVLLDDIVENPRREYLRVLDFLKVVDDGRVQFPIMNRARKPRWPRFARMLFVFTELKGRTGINFNLRLSAKLHAANIVDASRPALSPEMRAALQVHFAADIALLERLLNRDLGHWLEPAQPIASGDDLSELARATAKARDPDIAYA